jgi:hypothetical protein
VLRVIAIEALGRQLGHWFDRGKTMATCAFFCILQVR